MTAAVKYILVLCFFFTAGKIIAQPYKNGARIIINEDKDWLFLKDTAHSFDPAKNTTPSWQPVSLPHTWNVDDVLDDTPGYYRGIGWYKKLITITDQLKEKNIALYFEGADQQTEVFVNGNKAGSHTGGYTAFCIPVSKFLKKDGTANEILVKVDNSYNENVPPLSADFTFYGGIYRDVYLIATDAVHFSVTDNTSKGVYISAPVVSKANAAVVVRGTFINESSSNKNVLITTAIIDAENRKVILRNVSTACTAGEIKTFEQQLDSFSLPHLWSPEDPYLYRAITTISDATSGKQLDEVTNPLGFRWFHFDADKGFFLNGKNYKLIGASRHQDHKGMGNAVSKKIAAQDVAFIKKMGGNFLRIAHYPQDPAVLEACDRLGILASVEIPIVNEITESEKFYSNCEAMQVEMIRQNYNHPAVIIWCYMNEIFLRPHFSADKERQKIYFSAIAALAKRLDSITRKEDPYRYTMIANHGDFNRYNEYGLTVIPMLTGWNLYQGWYGSKLEDFPVFLDRHHEKLPKQPLLITEYGADADNRIRNFDPVRFDKSVEYAIKFHRFYITEFMKRPFVSGAVVWNLADFNSESRLETMPHMNCKGLLTWDRIPKDPYYLYQGIFLKDPFVKIMSTSWKIRSGIADSLGEFCYQPLQVAGNLSSLRLIVNGKKIGDTVTENNLATWNVPFVNGKNKIKATGYKNGRLYKDAVTVDFTLQPFDLHNKKTPFHQLNIILGTQRFFIDTALQQVWLPSQPYRKGSWGHIGGKAFIIGKSSALPYGTDKNIIGTTDDPVYQTQQVGIAQYRFDVPAGKYELTFHFAELEGGAVKYMPNNLSDSLREENSVKRIFHVLVNNRLFLENFNMVKEYGLAKAISKKTTVVVTGDDGITITFNAIEGEPVLNALQLKKLD